MCACVGEPFAVPRVETVGRGLQAVKGTCPYLPIVGLEDHDAFCTGIYSTRKVLAIFSQPDPCSLERKEIEL